MQAIEDARAYDLACALASLSPHVGADRAVDAALKRYPAAALGAAAEFLEFVSLRPDHDFETTAVREAIERAV